MIYHNKAVPILLGCLMIFSVWIGCSPQLIPPEETPAEDLPSEELPAEKLAEPTEIIEVPETEREFRAVWIATVANIDWPSKPDLSTEEQKAELRAMFDRIKMLNMNAVIFQVRPAGDALYSSAFEPWSEYLTGEQGKAPDPFYDPLEFAVEEAHRRGLELHAWINPFRVKHPTAKSDLAENHLSKTHPHLVHEYGRHLWMDPGHPESHDWSMKIIRDIVHRYDVDAIHIDDYFYPYPERDLSGRFIEFPDSTTYAIYANRHGNIDLDDWRRQNVDTFIQRMHKEIREIDPTVRFGISPSGLWQPDLQGEEIEGFNAFGKIYADSRKWFNEGWLDYFSPQLYWPTEQTGQRYSVLLNWWNTQNTTGKHFWPGNFTSRIRFGDDFWPVSEITDQILITRDFPGATGNVHFSMRILMMNPDGLLDGLGNLYGKPALVPATNWLGGTPPLPPESSLLHIDGNPYLEFQPAGEEAVWLYVVKKRYGDIWQTEIIPGWNQHISLAVQKEGNLPEAIVLTTVNRIGLESEPVIYLHEDIELSQ
ncbi:glycoside hydrolase family 10 protein [soil metagenome]